MKQIESLLEGIAIPSGNNYTDIGRAKAGIELYKRCPKKIPFLIMGVGKDISKSEKNSFVEEQKSIDYHKELHKLILDETQEKVGLDSKSRTSVENILYTFPLGQEGNYYIVTEKWHYEKFNFIAKQLKKKGLISENLNFIHKESNVKSYGFFRKFFSYVKSYYEISRLK